MCNDICVYNKDLFIAVALAESIMSSYQEKLQCIPKDQKQKKSRQSRQN